ncbi:hypothetical protein AAMO2058_000987900 [Amorphochlora amoebiformis]
MQMRKTSLASGPLNSEPKPGDNSEVHRNGSIETHPFSSEGSSKSKDPATARDNSCVNCCLVVCPLLTICCLGNSANKRVITCRS